MKFRTFDQFANGDKGPNIVFTKYLNHVELRDYVYTPFEHWDNIVDIGQGRYLAWDDDEEYPSVLLGHVE